MREQFSKLCQRWTEARGIDLAITIDRLTESPIEADLAAAFMAGSYDAPRVAWPESFPVELRHGLDSPSVGLSLAELPPQWVERRHDPRVRSCFWLGSRYWSALGVVDLLTQATVSAGGKTYRLDFAFVGESFALAVEADGHDYHERTKAQAEHDRTRDRAMQAEGWTVMRFTGSEIYRNAEKCAAEVEAVIVMENFRRMGATR